MSHATVSKSHKVSRPLVAGVVAAAILAASIAGIGKVSADTNAADAVIVVPGGTALSHRSAASTGTLGVLFAFDTGTLNGGTYANQGNTIFNLPLYRPTSDTTAFWNNYVEELTTAGVDFVAVNIRGYIPGKPVPNGGGDPRMLTGLVDAINRRGVAGQLKIAAFEDTPASLTDKKNQIKHNAGGYTPAFDLGDATGAGEGGYQYMWENNLKEYFTRVPDSLRYKINGQPVVYEWSINNFAFTNQGNGNAAKMLAHARTQAQAQFGVNPYFILDQSWLQRDPSVSAQANGVNNWFGVPSPSSTLATFNGATYGIAVPGFHFVNTTTNMNIDANHGQTLVNGLTATVGGGAKVTMLEGFTDWQENAALMRTAEGTYDQRRTDYPGQMINIIRRYSTNPFPATSRVEAETADAYTDTTSGNLWNVYRAGNLDVQPTTDSGGGWNVGSIASGERLEWQQVPLQGTTNFSVRVASTNATAKLRFVIDGTAGPTVTVPNTGDWQSYQTVSAGDFSFTAGTYHTVRIEFLTGNLNFNYWTTTRS